MSKELDILNKRILPVGEWLAENAYIAPGFHRLFTALGLTAGLYAGRKFTNVLVARHPNGEDMTRDEVYGPMKHFHGIMAYDEYDDTAEAKWHSVMDHLLPVVFGAAGAWGGSAYFFRTEKFHPIAGRLSRDIQDPSKWFMQHADYAATRVQSKYYNQISATNFTLGSTTGVHLFPNPFSQTASAIRFQLGAGKKIHAPYFPWLEKITGSSKSQQSYNLWGSLTDMISWAENNIANYEGTPWYKENNAIVTRAKNALQMFENVSPAQQKAFEDYIEQTIHKLEAAAKKVEAENPGMTGDALLKMLQKDKEFTTIMQDKFWGKGLEDEFVKLGLLDRSNPTKNTLALGDNGGLTSMSRIIGGSQETAEINKHWKNTLTVRDGKKTADELIDIAEHDANPDMKFIPGYLGHVIMAALGGVFAMSTLGAKHKEPKLDDDTLKDLRTKPRHEAAKEFHDLLEKNDPSSIITAINGKPLDTLHWLSNVFVVPPSLHRFMNAAALSAALYGGMKFSTALAGRNLRGVELAKDEVWSIFRPFYKKMHYNWKSEKTPDRWKRVAHQLIPVTVGAFGTYEGSRLFFQDKIDAAERAEYLEDYTEKISLDESEAYAEASAVTSILNTGSGAHLLPFASYSSNLQNRFVMASGQQVATPILGKWWSGNPSKYPYHVKKLLDFTVNYAVHNHSEYPKEFEPLAHALIAKLYPKLSGEELQGKVDALVDEIYAVRDHYFEPGGIPKDKIDDAKEAMTGLLRKEGLEKTLHRIGLNPLEADLDNNGQGAWVAHRLGSANWVRQDIKDYRTKAIKRMEKWNNRDAAPQTPDNKVTEPQEDKPLISKEKESDKEVYVASAPIPESHEARIAQNRAMFDEHPTLQ